MSAQGVEAPGENTPTDETLWEILRSGMKDLAERNGEACEILQSLAEEGSLEQHQTSGGLDAIADRLLGTLKSGERADAD